MYTPRHKILPSPVVSHSSQYPQPLHFSNMKKIYLAVFFGTLITISAAAQNSLFTPGYIVVNKDTLRGLLEREDEMRMSNSILFKKDMQSTEKRYSVSDASAFGFDSDHLKFEAVTADLRKENEVKTVTRFAKVLLSGFSNLYKLQVPEDERLVVYEISNSYIYIVQKENHFATLGMYEFVKPLSLNNDRVSVGINRNYRDVLKYNVFSDCPGVLKNIDGLEFDDKSMTKAVKEYNQCRKPEVKSVEQQYIVKKIIRHGVELGYVNLPVNDSFMTNPTGFMVGYFWDIIRPDISRSISLRLAPNYAYLKTTDDIDKPHPKTTYDIHLIRLPILAQINFNKVPDAKVIPYLAIGPVFGVGIKNDSRLKSSFSALHFEVGSYLGKCKVAAFVDNPGLFQFGEGYSVNFTFGYRFK